MSEYLVEGVVGYLSVIAVQTSLMTLLYYYSESELSLNQS